MSNATLIYPPTGGSGGGGITSINGDTTAAQLIVGGTGITVASASGTTTISSSGSSGANTALSNLTTTSINQSLLPTTDATIDLGSVTDRFNNGYFANRVGVGSTFPTTGVHNFLELTSGTDGVSAQLNAYIVGSNFGNITFSPNATWNFGGGGMSELMLSPNLSFLYSNNSPNFQWSNSDYRMFNADFAIFSVGRGIQIKEGTNARQGIATLTAGVVVVSNTTVSANTRIFLTAQDNNSVGALRVSARTAGTSFTITSSDLTDSGSVAYEMFEAL